MSMFDNDYDDFDDDKITLSEWIKANGFLVFLCALAVIGIFALIAVTVS
jgi:hypothetical protein